MTNQNFLQTYSFTVSVVYFTVYAFVFLIASIVCAYHVSQDMLKHEKYNKAKRNVLECTGTTLPRSYTAKRESTIRYKPPFSAKHIATRSNTRDTTGGASIGASSIGASSVGSSGFLDTSNLDASVEEIKSEEDDDDDQTLTSHYTLDLENDTDSEEFDELQFMDLMHAKTMAFNKPGKKKKDIFCKILKHKNRKWYYPFQLWFVLMWKKKRCYMSLVPYLMDQATDFGAIWEYYYIWQNDPVINGYINCKWLFMASIGVILLHRVASSVIIYNLTKKWYYALLQMFELMMIRAIFTNYKLDADEPSNGQRYLALLESMFESTPQLLIAAVFIIRTAGVQQESGGELIFLSFLASLYCLSSKVVSDDRYTLKLKWRSLEYRWKKCSMKLGCINWRYVIRALGWRFAEITARISLFSLLWIAIGGVGMMFVIFLEVSMVIYIAYVFKNVDFLGNIMCYTIAHHATDKKLTEKWLKRVEYYKLIMPYVYIVLVLLFASLRFDSWKVPDYEDRNQQTTRLKFGQGLLVYCFMATVLHQIVYFRVLKAYDAFTGNDGKTRTINPLLIQERYQEALELLEFGASVQKQHDEKTGFTILNYLCSIDQKKIGHWLVIDDIVVLLMKKYPELANIPTKRIAITTDKTYRKSPLQQAIEIENLFLVSTLCRVEGIDVMKTDPNSADGLNSELFNKTALHLAWFTSHDITHYKSHEEKHIKVKLCMIKTICSLHPNLILVKDLLGNTFVHKAMILPPDICIAVIKIFIKTGGIDCIYSKNNFEQTILHTACQRKKTKLRTIQFLVEQCKFDVYINKTDNFNRTPRNYAEQNKLTKLVEYFEKFSNGELVQTVMSIIDEAEEEEVEKEDDNTLHIADIDIAKQISNSPIVL